MLCRHWHWPPLGSHRELSEPWGSHWQAEGWDWGGEVMRVEAGTIFNIFRFWRWRWTTHPWLLCAARQRHWRCTVYRCRSWGSLWCSGCSPDIDSAGTYPMLALPRLRGTFLALWYGASAPPLKTEKSVRSYWGPLWTNSWSFHWLGRTWNVPKATALENECPWS